MPSPTNPYSGHEPNKISFVPKENRSPKEHDYISSIPSLLLSTVSVKLLELIVIN